MGSRILVVDDDPSVRRMLARTLSADGHEVEAVADGGQALAAVQRSAPDAVVLDVAMPGMDGLTVCRRLRAGGLTAPILLLTARDEIADRVAGLDAGADDYLVKPFAVEELSARLRALSRRGPPQSARTVVASGRLTLDTEARTAAYGGKTVALTERECDLLALLMRNAGQVITRDVALERIWGAAVDNVVDRYVAQLRRKLADPGLIRTVRGVGFVLDAR